MPASRRPVAIDLFSGVGGLGLGFEAAGFDVVSAVEYDPVHAAVHLYNFPSTDIICADIAEVSKEQILASARRGVQLHYPGEVWDGVVDVIVGGPSCQGFSVMGRQDTTDERNKLVLEFVRLVELIRPRAFCMENVPGLLDARFDLVRNHALMRLREAGYAVSGDQTVLRAEDFGVPQKRRRVMIMGIREGGTAPEIPLSPGDTRFTVADAFVGLPKMTGAVPSGPGDAIRIEADVLARVRRSPYMSVVDRQGDGGGEYGHARSVDRSLISGCRPTLHSRSSIERFQKTPQGKKEAVSRLYRLSNDGLSLTLRAGTGRERGSFSAARPLHPTEHRVVTVREAARLHSFPDWFRFHTTNWHGHRQIGNAVPPLLARAAARSILRALGHAPTRSKRDRMPIGDETLLSLSPTAAATRMGTAADQVPHRRRQKKAA